MVDPMEPRRLLAAVTAVAPLNGAASVAAASNITVTFDVAINAATINSSTLQLRNASNQLVSAAVTYNSSTRTATLDPAANLPTGNVYYYAKVVGGASGVKDSNGNALATDFNWAFTTGTLNFTESAVFTGLNGPVAVEFSPDGRVFVAERRGVIKVFDSLTDTTPDVFADLRTNVHNYWDRGLLGMALHPNFPATPYVYVLYTYDADINGVAPKYGTANVDSDPSGPDPFGVGTLVSGRLSRLTASGNQTTGAEQVMINDWVQQFPSHSIGHIQFGPDGMLYASSGDAASFNFVDYGQNGNPFGDPVNEGGALRSQDLRSAGDPTGLDGSIIRIDPITGAAATGNPITTGDANARRIIAYGLRNPFRFTIRPGTSEVWAGDVGWNEWEEINRVLLPTDSVVENFGWPAYEGTGRQSGYDSQNLPLLEAMYGDSTADTKPYYTYRHADKVVPGSSEPTGGSSITGLAFYNTGLYPAAFDGALFFCDYSRKYIYVMYRGVDGLPNPGNRAVFKATTNGPVELQIGPGGDLFYVDLNGNRIMRFTANGATNNAPTANITSDVTTGNLPLTINFSGLGSSDPDAGDLLSYAWDLDGDGQYNDSTSPTPSYTYTVGGERTVRLRVTDRAGLTGVASLLIRPGNNAPLPTILTPSSTLNWKVGDTINFSGSATDSEDGSIPASGLSWTLVLVHANEIDPNNTHTHTLQSFSGVASGSFSAPEHEYPSWLELRLTATDSLGLSAFTTLRLDPRTVMLSFASNPTGLQVTVNSSTYVTPFGRTVIVGSTNSVIAISPQTVGSTTYAFNNWSNGGAQSHLVTAPLNAATYIASYNIQSETKLTGAIIGTPGSYQGAGNGREKAFDGSIATFFDAPESTNGNGAWAGLDLGSALVVSRIRYAPRTNWSDRMLGGKFQGSNTPDFSSGVTDFTTIVSQPVEGIYTSVNIGTGTAFRYVRYLSPNGGWGNVSELEFYTNTLITLPGAPSALQGTPNGTTNANLSWIDTSSNESGFRVERSTTSNFASVVGFEVSANTIAFADSGLTPGATYYYRVRAFNSAGNSGWSSTATVVMPVNTNLQKLNGAVIGTTGSYQNSSNTRDKALDGNINTFFDAPESTAGNGAWVGLDLGGPFAIHQVRFVPRQNWATRMVGGKFQASNSATFSSGVVDLYTVGFVPTQGIYTVQDVSSGGTYRYVRYLSPNGGWGNIAEVEFYTSSSTVPGTGLNATYFDNIDLTGTTFTRVDPTIAFDWGLGSPNAAIQPDTFSARWTGQVRAEFSQTYTFHVLSDNGVRLWVNNQLIIDRWIDVPPAEYTGSIDLVANTRYDIRLEYFEAYGGASVTLSWSGASTPKQLIPSANLYTTSGGSSPFAGRAMQTGGVVYGPNRSGPGSRSILDLLFSDERLIV